MKNTYNMIWSLVLLLAVVASCQRRLSYPSLFHVVDSLTYVQPDSAMKLLAQMETEMPAASKPVRMYYQLLTIKAADKAYITHTSDSLMLEVLHYYEHGGDRQLLPEAYYYMGSTYRDLNDAPRALEYYQKALEAMPKGASVLYRVVNNQMGFLFYRQYLYEEALSCYKRSFQNDSIMDNKYEMSSDLKNIGYIYRCQNDYETSLKSYLRAKDMLGNSDDVNALDEIDTQIAGIYIPLGRYEDALETIQSPLKHVSRSTISSVYSIAAKAYLGTGNIDMASYYFKELLKVGNIYGQQAAYEQLAALAIQENNIDAASDYLASFRVLTDSISRITATESVARMNSQYNYQKALEEREAIAARNNANRWIIFLLLFSLVIIVSGILAFIKEAKRRKAAMQEKLDELEQTQEMMHSMAVRSIAEKNERIMDLELQLQAIGDTNAALTKQIESQRVLIRQQVIDAEEKLSQRDQMDAALKTSRIYGRLIHLINNKKKLGAGGLDELTETFYAVSPQFMEKLSSLCVMNSLELEVTLLRRIGISPNDIASLTNYSKQHISGIRKGLFKKVTGLEGKPAQWDEMISLL